MSGTYEDRGAPAHGTDYSPSVGTIAGVGTSLVFLNVVLILALSFVPPVVALGNAVFGNFFVGIAVFAVTVGGGKWVASKGVEEANTPLAGVGVAAIQAGYGLFGATVLAMLAGVSLRFTALGITAVLTALVTALAVVLVYRTDHSFERWNWYSMGMFVLGFVVGAVGFFVSPLLLLGSSVVFFLAFVANLIYEIWAVKENRYASDLRNAIGIYVAVMGVFVNILIWVVRLLSILDQ